MKVKELIEELKNFDGELEVQYDYDWQYNTVPIETVYIENESYEKDRKKIVVIY